MPQAYPKRDRSEGSPDAGVSVTGQHGEPDGELDQAEEPLEQHVPGRGACGQNTREILGEIRNLEGFYVEKDEETFVQLHKVLAQTDHTFRCYQGDVEDHLPEIMKAVGAAPLFAFFDPFGLGVPFDMLTKHILSRKRGLGGPATELLLNFSLPGLRRNAGHLTSSSNDPIYLKTRRPKLVERVDATLGGDWWHPIWEAGGEDREAAIVSGYVDRLRTAPGGWAHVTIPVQNRWDGPPVYCLVLLTSYEGGLWAFAQVLSTAMEEYREYAHQAHGMLDLDPLEDREARWIDHIAENLERHLAEQGSFVVGQTITVVFGETVGFARETHIRQAVKRLCAAGSIRTEVYDKGKLRTGGQGPVEKRRILPP
jgi:three-Cys-motif partner protein